MEKSPDLVDLGEATQMGTSAVIDGRRQRRKYVVAVVLGTALSALGSAPVDAGVAQPALKAVTDLSRYCTACWRNARLHPDCWMDCTQEVLCRLLERVDPDSWNQALTSDGEERREFIRAIDTVKKRSQRSRKLQCTLVGDVPDCHSLHERSLANDLEAVDQAAGQLLTSRQRQILQLSFKGWQVADIAAKMKLPAERISDEKYKAIRKLREHFTKA